MTFLRLRTHRLERNPLVFARLRVVIVQTFAVKIVFLGAGLMAIDAFCQGFRANHRTAIARFHRVRLFRNRLGTRVQNVPFAMRKIRRIFTGIAHIEVLGIRMIHVDACAVRTAYLPFTLAITGDAFARYANLPVFRTRRLAVACRMLPFNANPIAAYEIPCARSGNRTRVLRNAFLLVTNVATAALRIADTRYRRMIDAIPIGTRLPRNRTRRFGIAFRFGFAFSRVQIAVLRRIFARIRRRTLGLIDAFPRHHIAHFRLIRTRHRNRTLRLVDTAMRYDVAHLRLIRARLRRRTLNVGIVYALGRRQIAFFRLIHTGLRRRTLDLRAVYTLAVETRFVRILARRRVRTFDKYNTPILKTCLARLRTRLRIAALDLRILNAPVLRTNIARLTIRRFSTLRLLRFTTTI